MRTSRSAPRARRSFPRPPDDAKTQRPQPIFPELLINHDLTRRPAAEEFRLGVLHRPVEFTDQPYPRPVEVGAPDGPPSIREAPLQFWRGGIPSPVCGHG